MKISPTLLTSLLGIATSLSLSAASPAPTAKTSAEPHDHATEKASGEHEHKGETCDGHDHGAEHKQEEADAHTHEGEPCTGHDHKEGEAHDHAEEAAHNHKDGEECDGHDHGAEPSAADMVPVKIDDKARISLDMRVEPVVARPHKAGKTFYGQMEIPPHAIRTFALSAGGRVNLHVQSAQQVKKGDLLYTLESPDILELKGKVAEDEAALLRNSSELETLTARQQQLAAIGTKNSELETSIRFKQAEKPGLEAALENSRGKLALATSRGELVNNVLHVRADRDGSVQSVDINQGAWGEQGTPVLVLTNKGELEFRATAYAADPLQYSGVKLALTSPDGKETALLDGKLRVADQINPATSTRALYFVPDRLPATAYAGQVARLEMNAGDDAADGYYPVPNSAIVKVGINDVVFIQDKADKNLFIMKKVETLPSRQGMTPVKGLEEGQTIVTRGGYELKYALPAEGGVEKKAAGHFHADGKFHEGGHDGE